MLKRLTMGMVIWVLVFNLSGMASPLHAEMISTGHLLSSTGKMSNVAQENSLDRIRSYLDREDVREQLLAMGVAPEEIENRLGALTQKEIARIEQRLNDMPAGGNALAVIGAVFLVLLILELVGVTNVFTRF